MTKVLFLDDDPERHATFAVMARRQGWEVVYAHNFREAYLALRGHRFDVVYLDRDLADHQPRQVGLSGATLTGEEVVQDIIHLPRSRRPCRVVIHSWNPDAGRRMRDALLAHGIPAQYRPLGDPRCRDCGALISRHDGDNRRTLVCP